MKTLIRHIAVLTVISTLALAQSAFAGECCKKVASATKEGKTCEKHVSAKCCKKAASDVAKNVTKGEKAKECAKCAADKKTEKQS